MHKKLNLEAQAKRRVRRVVKTVRAPSGITVEDLKKKIKKDVPAAKKDAAAGPVRQAAVKEAKEKAKKDAAARKATRAAAPKAAAAKSHAGKGR
jgi:hypothetical protein